MSENTTLKSNPLRNTRVGLVVLGIGTFLYIVGIDPAIFRLDRSSVFGFIQIAVFLSGLGLICLGGYIALNSLWNGSEKSIIADIGQRLVATGYVVALGSALADIFGFGAHTFPSIPYFGRWQTVGVLIAIILIIAGFAIMIPRPGRKTNENSG